MNKRKFLILSVLAIFVVAMSLSFVSASKTKTTTLKINKKEDSVKLKNGDSIEYTYESKVNMPAPQGVHVGALYIKNGNVKYPKHTKVVKVTVWFKKGHKVIQKSSTKVRGSGISINLVKGYKPYKVKVYYKNK